MSDDTPDFPDFGGMEGAGDIGKLGLTIYRGVLRDGGSPQEAFMVTAAFFAGTLSASQARADDDED